MVTSVRAYSHDDFPMVEAWWRDHHGNDFRPSYPAKKSYIVEFDGTPAAFFGVAPMTPAFSYLAFPLVNPSLNKDARDKAVDALVDYAKMTAADEGFPVLWISIRGEKFLNRLGAKGFVTGEDGNKHMFCKVREIA